MSTEQDDSQAETYHRTLSAILARVETTLEETAQQFPYVFDKASGTWETTPNGNWCGGHWIGLLWLAAAQATDRDDSERFARAARDHTETMRSYMPSDSMFCGMNFLYAGFRAYDHTSERGLFGLGMEGADAMVTAYDGDARQIPLGKLDIHGPEQFRGPASEHGPPGDRLGAVDNLYTAASILWRADAESTDSRFRDVALSHADRHLDWYIRDDGRTWHHAVFDDDGTLVRQYNELAHSDESCWARGQAWSIAGLANAYRATRADRFRRALDRQVGYYRRQSPPDLIPHWDFEVPDSEAEPRDTSAAAITAYGLCRSLPDEQATADLRSFGMDILDSLVESYVLLDPDHPAYGRIQHGCFNRPGDYAVDTELVWTAYYLAATLASVTDGR